MSRREDTVDRLRSDIDAGRTRDKVDASDPAASPLGTDDEAAGAPPTVEEVQLAREAELGRAEGESVKREAGILPILPRNDLLRGAAIVLAGAALVVLLVVLAFWIS
ncbi:MAG TPA: hypothetical protein VKA18_04795 [Alphaproteobacteria bacterium]|nr:hypothetical protein [Alphaproteobacteria bacterium]